MFDQDAALAHHLLKIARAYLMTAIPTDGPKNGFTLEVAALEVRHPILPSSRGNNLIDRLQGLQESRFDTFPALNAVKGWSHRKE